MNYWLVRGSPAENGDFGFMKPGKRGQWRTKRPPRNWQSGDRLLFWASSPRRELISLGEFHGETGRRTADDEVLYSVRYLTGVVAHPIHIAELRTDPALQQAIFLKKGPAVSVTRLTNSEGEHLYRLLISENKRLEGIWPDLETRDAAITDVDESAIEGERRLVQDLRQERSRPLIEAKKKAVLLATGALACEVCGFDFKARYGALGEGFCEVHHKNPLSATDGASITRLQDFAVVCSNCHRIIHKTSCAMSVQGLRRRLLNAQQHAPADGPKKRGSAAEL